ncbi:hypothetical protein L0F63_005813 [Massospora cicadina]|nr:hypothetical protein L0F63_005813 [Massospora cicadina]
MNEVRETRHAQLDETDLGEIKVNQYVIKELIGKGAFGFVSLAVDTHDGKEYAFKEFSKARLRHKKMSRMMRPVGQGGIRGRRTSFAIRARSIQTGEAEDSMDLIRGELAILKKLNHLNIIKLFEVIDIDDDDVLYMVFEMCHGGPIQKVSLTEPFDPYPEEAGRKFMRGIILGVEYLHENGIVHRDLKPDNILLSGDGTLKIADFGVSEIFTGGYDKVKGAAGSPAFMAPELFDCRQEYSAKAADLWAIGVILFGLCFGRLPFSGGNVIEIREAILNQEYVSAVIPDNANRDLEDLVKKLLLKDPLERITMDALRVHPWVTAHGTQPLISIEENTKHAVREITEDEVRDAIKTIGSALVVVSLAYGM